MMNSSMAEQLRLEEEMLNETRARYFRLHENAQDRDEFSDTHAGRSIFDHLYKPFLDKLNEWTAERVAGKAGRRSNVVKMIEEFGDNETLAFIFVKTLINTTMTLNYRDKKKIARMTRVALVCTQAIHDELRMRYFAENRKALLRKLVKDFDKRDLPRRRRRDQMIKQFNTQKLQWEAEGWKQSNRLPLGVTLIDLFQRATGAIEEFDFYDGPRTIRCLSFTQKMVETLGERMDKAADLFTVYMPMVVPPRPWTNDALVGGGYYSDKVQPYKMVKGAKYEYLAELENRDMSAILEPLNAIQETPWRVNPVMVDVLDHVFSNNIECKGLPPADPKSMPDAPFGIETDEEVAKEYRKDCFMVHDYNRRAISKRISVLRTISMASKFAKYEAIYFPMDLDSRGRAYPKVPFLNPQGPDYVKGLLEFSKGKPVYAHDYSLYYLTIAIANAWGQDKLPLDERAQWVEDNQDMLVEVATDPKTDLRWLQADEPFMALRGALEWLGYAEHGDGYVSHMPIHFDATCSGLQHFSALLRDAEGGLHVNLTSNPERQDIYGAVAKKTEASLRLAADTCDIARVALSMGISRSLCKRPVMIVPYAGTFAACMEYVNDHYKERAENGEALPVELGEIRKTVAPLVAKHVWEAISSTVIAARGAMDWITKTARLASKGNNTPIQWTTPDGFVVQQAKYEEKENRINTYLDGGRRVRLHLSVETPNLDARRMAQSLSPNYIHSLDACHLRGAVRKAEKIGGMSYAMIHDSFGVHAADMGRFVEECIKPAFVEMYDSGDTLEKFRQELVLNIEDTSDVPPMPPMGTLDIHEVNRSQFFFS